MTNKTGKTRIKSEMHRWKLVGGPFFVKRTDMRYAQYMVELKETGVSPDETWDLALVISQFVLPRLRLFRKLTVGIPCDFSSLEEWQAVLDKMIRAFELCAEDSMVRTDEEKAQMNEGLDLFREYFRALWW